MYAIEEKQRVLPDGIEITTYSREIDNANILSVEAGTTGYEGGDSGHGGRTYFKIEDLGGTDIEVHPIGEDGLEGFEVFLGGDSELNTIIDALKFIVEVLEDQKGEPVVWRSPSDEKE